MVPMCMDQDLEVSRIKLCAQDHTTRTRGEQPGSHSSHGGRGKGVKVEPSQLTCGPSTGGPGRVSGEELPSPPGLKSPWAGT